jgi:uncharacterized protein
MESGFDPSLNPFAPLLRYGVLSDTHGTIHPGIFAAFEGVRHIFHCGDLGHLTCKTELEVIAPVSLVRGNMDGWSVASCCKELLMETVEFGDVALYHGTRYGHSNEAIMRGLSQFYAPELPRMICYGHSHQAQIDEVGHTLFINPGSATYPHGSGSPTAALVEFNPEKHLLVAWIVELDSFLASKPKG